jgi:glycosyltransferase involved in cell wall biosynthesis
MTPVSVLVLTCNESANIAACLDSIAGWADEIVVVDSGSTDDTIAIARTFHANVVHHDYIDHRSQLTWALAHAPIRNEWILLLDADNRVSDELKASIGAALPSTTSVAFYCRHQYYFRGGLIRGFKPYSLRLFRRSTTSVDESELVDFRLIPDGPLGTLDGILIEDNKKENDLVWWTNKHAVFARRLAAEEALRHRGVIGWSTELSPRLFGTHDQRIAFLRNVWYRCPRYVRAYAYFIYRYVFRLGFLDGLNGLMYHTLHALWFRLMIDGLLADVEKRLRTGELTVGDLLQDVNSRR